MPFSLENLESRTLLSLAGPAAIQAPVATGPSAVVAVCGRAAADAVNIPDPVLLLYVRHAVGQRAGDISRRAMLHLKVLRASVGPSRSAGIRSLEGLQYATNLRELMIYNNDVKDLSPISHLAKLVRLDVGRNRISDVRPIRHLTELRRVVLAENRIKDIRPLSTLTKTRVLWLDYNRITDMRPLARLSRLVYLNISYNPLRSLKTLPALPNPLDLLIAGTGVADLGPLLRLARPGYIEIIDNPVDLSPGSAADLVIAELRRRGAVVESDA